MFCVKYLYSTANAKLIITWCLSPMYLGWVGPNSTEYIIPEKNKYRGVFELSSGPRA